MKAFTLEILRGRFLPSNTFSLLLKAVCIIASRQWVKHFLKTQLCFCRLILNRKKTHSAEWGTHHWAGGAVTCNGVGVRGCGGTIREGMAVCNS